MKLLRNMIRQIILSEVKIMKQLSTRDNIAFKKYFRKNANQQSLKKLRFIHWGSPEEITGVLNADGRSEISTAIHPASGPIYPWNLDADESTVGIELEGFVTFAANVDVDSGRDSFKHRLPTHSLPKSKEFQKKTSGFPKRPSVDSIENRIKAAELYRKRKKDPQYKMSDEELDIYWNHGIDWREEEEDDPYFFGRAGKEYKKKEDVLILRAEDLVPTEEGYYFEDDLIGLWPEATLDNWKPVKLYIPMELYQDNFDSFDDDAIDLVDSARSNNIRVVAHD